jgi:hypothetical protein
MEKKEKKPLPCPHGRAPMHGLDGWRHCPHCLGINNPNPLSPEDWIESDCNTK